MVLLQRGVTVSYTHLDVYKRQELKNETGFASFTVPNQVGDSTISEAEATNTVAIKMPFGTDLTPVSYTHLIEHSLFCVDVRDIRYPFAVEPVRMKLPV